MRRALWWACLLLPLGGCYVDTPAPDYGYAQPGYPPPPPGSDPYAGAYPGYSYNNGAPVYDDAGVAVPLVFFGGAWGYYDHNRHWHSAPPGISRDMDVRRAGGGPYHPGPPPHPEGYPRPGQPGPAGYHPGEPPRPNEGPRPGPGAPPHQNEQHEHHRDCPPGQHC